MEIDDEIPSPRWPEERPAVPGLHNVDSSGYIQPGVWCNVRDVTHTRTFQPVCPIATQLCFLRLCRNFVHRLLAIKAQ